MTTKAEERKALAQIRKIVDGLGEDSYIGTAMAGMFEDAEENIENDFALSWKERAETASRNCEHVHEAWEKVSADLKVEKQNAAREREKYQQLRNDFDQLRIEKFEAENRAGCAESQIVDLKNEIVNLKAKLYDLLVK